MKNTLGGSQKELAILGLGTAVGPTRVTQEEAAEVTKRICHRVQEYEDMMLGFYKNAGIRTRSTVLGWQVVRDILEGTWLSKSPYVPPPDGHYLGPTTWQRMEHYIRHAPELAIEAGRKALQDSQTAPAAITHLVTVSCTGFHAPGFDIALVKELGLPATVERTHIGFMGCQGALNGLRVARALAAGDPKVRVLLCAVETCSLHFHYDWNPKKLIANALFADGAAALVGKAAETGEWRLAANGSCLLPDCEDTMTWDIGDHGFEMTLSKRVPELIQEHLRGWFVDWLGAQGLRLEEISSWAVHPGGPRILEGVEAALGLDRQVTAVSREVLAECGNMSSPTVLFVLERLRQRRAPRPCVALAFGPGLTAEAAVFV